MDEKMISKVDTEEVYTGEGIRKSIFAKTIPEEDTQTAIQEWYDWADETRTLQGLVDLITALLGRFQQRDATLPHAAAAIALGALKLVETSEQGNLSKEQWFSTMWSIIRHMTGLGEEPLKIMRLLDILSPDGHLKYWAITQAEWDLMKNVAQQRLSENSGLDPSDAEHLLRIVNGEVPFGLKIV